MLDTDLCLAYNKDYTVTNAGDCCTWWSHPANEFCGTNRRQCCEQFPQGPDCGSTALTGAAANDVLDFSGGNSNSIASRITGENRWIEVFLRAWGKATSNGFSDLQSLVY